LGGGRGLTRQKYGGFTSHNPRHLFFLDSQGRIRIRLLIACYFKRRCFGEIGTSAFLQPKAETLIFVLGRSWGEKIRVRLSRKDLIQIPGKVMKVLGSGIMEVHCDNDVTVTGRLSGRMKMHRIKVMVGDQVHVSVSPYDPSHGLITYRLK
jgi:translation initiation factor IF-1